jgi:hypothetical protein
MREGGVGWRRGVDGVTVQKNVIGHGSLKCCEDQSIAAWCEINKKIWRYPSVESDD